VPEFTEQVRIARSAGDVWTVLSDFGNVADWAPFVVRSFRTTDGDLGVGSRRFLRHRWGFTLDEAVTRWEEDRCFSYRVFGAPYPLRELHEVWSISPNGRGVVLTTQMTYEVHLGALGRLVDRLVVRRLLRRAIRIGHRGLKEHIEGRAPIAASGAAPPEPRL
jgi:hypothetical protein